MTQGRLVTAVLLTGLISACSSGGEDEIVQWMAAERNQTRPRIPPIPAPKQFIPEAYTDTSAMEPFSVQKLVTALRTDSLPSVSNTGLVAPELIRRKEPLEAYPLDTMAFVGSITKAGQSVALVRVDGLLYQVRAGAYLGQNYGKVTRITETQMTLREIVQDASGEWTERAANLELQERAK
jgi:type IV pilus assembly protein PilP